jgi:Concanavalin A-like lectin/glucanases superfamily
VSGLNQLEKVDCVSACDGGSDEASLPDGSNEASLPDGSNDAAGVTRPDANGADATSDVNAGSPEGGDASVSEGGGASAYRAAVLADSPVGYWRLGDPPGTTSCQPEDGLGSAGAVTGGVIFGVPGALKNDSNTAAQFDGTTGSIDVGAALTFTGTSPFSWEIWVRPAVLDGNFRPFLGSMTFDNEGNPVDGTYMVSYSVAMQNFGFERYNASNAVFALDSAGLQVSVWTYIVGTSDAAGTGFVYMNGAPVISTGSTGAVPNYAADTIFGLRFKGDLDEVAIYDHALSAQSVLNHWSAAQ